MSTFLKLPGHSRDQIGTTASRRMRVAGSVPAVVYGHKQEPASILIESDDVATLMRSGSRLVDLEINGSVEQTIVKAVQWDTFGIEILHLDFLRVDRDEKVKLDVPVVLRGTAPGTLAGGVLEIPHHSVHVECLAVEIPENIPVRVGHLGIGESIHVSDLTDIPATMKILSPPEMVLVHIEPPQGGEEADEAGAESDAAG